MSKFLMEGWVEDWPSADENLHEGFRVDDGDEDLKRIALRFTTVLDTKIPDKYFLETVDNDTAHRQIVVKINGYHETVVAMTYIALTLKKDFGIDVKNSEQIRVSVNSANLPAYIVTYEFPVACEQSDVKNADDETVANKVGHPSSHGSAIADKIQVAYINNKIPAMQGFAIYGNDAVNARPSIKTAAEKAGLDGGDLFIFSFTGNRQELEDEVNNVLDKDLKLAYIDADSGIAIYAITMSQTQKQKQMQTTSTPKQQVKDKGKYAVAA